MRNATIRWEECSNLEEVSLASPGPGVSLDFRGKQFLRKVSLYFAKKQADFTDTPRLQDDQIKIWEGPPAYRGHTTELIDLPDADFFVRAERSLDHLSRLLYTINIVIPKNTWYVLQLGDRLWIDGEWFEIQKHHLTESGPPIRFDCGAILCRGSREFVDIKLDTRLKRKTPFKPNGEVITYDKKSMNIIDRKECLRDDRRILRDFTEYLIEAVPIV